MTVRKGYVDGPYGQIHYREAGAGPALLLLHQSPSSSVMYLQALQPLADSGLRVIAPDTPGFGLSDVPPEVPEICDYARALMAVVDGLELESVVVLGHHTGASIATEMAIADPDRVRRIILNGPAVLSEQERADWRQALKDNPAPEIREDGSHFADQWKKRAHFTPGWTSLRAMHLGVLQMFIAGEKEWYGHHAAFAHDLGEALPRVTCPALILTNTGDDIYASALKTLELRPDFDFEALEGGTHDIVDEQTEAWCKIVSEYALGQR